MLQEIIFAFSSWLSFFLSYLCGQVVRDYDEEEKGFASGSDRIREDSEPRSSGSPPPLEPEEVEVEDKDSDHQPVDMDMSD